MRENLSPFVSLFVATLIGQSSYLLFDRLLRKSNNWDPPSFDSEAKDTALQLRLFQRIQAFKSITTDSPRCSCSSDLEGSSLAFCSWCLLVLHLFWHVLRQSLLSFIWTHITVVVILNIYSHILRTDSHLSLYSQFWLPTLLFWNLSFLCDSHILYPDSHLLYFDSYVLYPDSYRHCLDSFLCFLTLIPTSVFLTLLCFISHLLSFFLLPPLSFPCSVWVETGFHKLYDNVEGQMSRHGVLFLSIRETHAMTLDTCFPRRSNGN